MKHGTRLSEAVVTHLQCNGHLNQGVTTGNPEHILSNLHGTKNSRHSSHQQRTLQEQWHGSGCMNRASQLGCVCKQAFAHCWSNPTDNYTPHQQPHHATSALHEDTHKRASNTHHCHYPFPTPCPCASSFLHPPGRSALNCTDPPDNLGAWVKVLVHPVSKAKQLLPLGLHPLQEACRHKPQSSQNSTALSDTAPLSLASLYTQMVCTQLMCRTSAFDTTQSLWIEITSDKISYNRRSHQ